MAFVFIMGLMIHAMSAPPAPSYASSVNTEETRDSAGRGSLPSISQESESIDSFNVHPANRWSEVEAGAFEDEHENGEFKFKGYINDSASMYRYRDAETTSGDIETRWRLNATADFETNETDYASYANNSFGPDGWSFEEPSLDDWNERDAADFDGVTATGGELIGDITAAEAFVNLQINTLDENFASYTGFKYRVRSNASIIQNQYGFDNATGPFVINGTSQAITTSYQTLSFTHDLSDSGVINIIFIGFKDEAGNFEGDEGIFIDWILWTNDDEYPGDFEIPLMGLNVTTDEGSGNSSLNAYPWNSTHYILRPTFTTDDGTNWRSWNIGSDYQDFAQSKGLWGADGWDFIEGTADGMISFSGGVLTTTDLGYLNVSRAVPDPNWGYVVDNTDFIIDPSLYGFIQIKLRAGGSSVNNLRFAFIDDGVAERTVTLDASNNISAAWTIYSANLTAIATWTGSTGGIRGDLRIKMDTDSLGWFLVDYMTLTSNNDSSDLTFFEYETYYRAKSKYDLMESTLNWKISDDGDNKLVSTVQGSFKIEDFFEPAALIRDISLGTVGGLDYFFGLRSAGANATTWWDFYKADFTEFNFQLRSGFPTEVGGDTWESEAPFSAFTVNDGGAATTVQTLYDLVVPEFDSTSGRLTYFENSTNSLGAVVFSLSTVDIDDGATTFFLAVALAGGDVGPPPLYDAAHRMETQDAGGSISSYLLDDNRGSDISFSIYLDKQLRKITLQVGFVNSSGAPISLTFTDDMDADDSNEVVLTIDYLVLFNAVATTEVHLAVPEWDLVFRDIYGIPLPGPDIGGGSPLPKDPIGFLLQAFRDLAGIMQGSLDEILAQGATLTTILNNIITIATNSVAMAASLASLVTDIAQVLLDLDSLISNTGGLVADFTTLLADSSSMVADLTQMVTDFSTLLADTSSMVSDLGDVVTGVSDLPADFISLLSDTGNLLDTLGDIFDELVDALGDSWLGQIFDELVALALGVATEILDELISRAVAVMAAVVAAISTYFRGLTFAGVTIGDLIDIIDVWLLLWWTVASDIIGFGINFLSIWAQVFLMGLLGIILLWAAATANGDGFLFMEKMAWAMTRNINPIAFILDVEIPLGLILLGNLFWTVFASYDWQGLLDPALMMPIALAHFTLGSAYEIPNLDDQWQIFFDFMNDILDAFFDVFLDILFFGLWGIFVDLLDSDILGVAPEIVVFIIMAGVAVIILIDGKRF